MVLMDINSKPQVYPYGILGRASTVIEETDGHWVNGFDYVNEVSLGGVSLSNICDEDTSTIITGGSGSLEYKTFNVETVYACSTMGMRPDEIEKIAVERAKGTLQFAIERELWSGPLASQDAGTENRWLSDSPEITVGPVTDPFDALALAEAQVPFIVPGFTGTIHVPPLIASHWKLKEYDGVLRTRLGTKVIVGQGYGFDGDNEGKIYVTGDVTVIVGETRVRSAKTESVNISINSITAYTDTPVAVVWGSSDHAEVTVNYDPTTP